MLRRVSLKGFTLLEMLIAMALGLIGSERPYSCSPMRSMEPFW